MYLLQFNMENLLNYHSVLKGSSIFGHLFSHFLILSGHPLVPAVNWYSHWTHGKVVPNPSCWELDFLSFDTTAQSWNISYNQNHKIKKVNFQFLEKQETFGFLKRKLHELWNWQTQERRHLQRGCRVTLAPQSSPFVCFGEKSLNFLELES